jgi:hypothetical protein
LRVFDQQVQRELELLAEFEDLLLRPYPLQQVVAGANVVVDDLARQLLHDAMVDLQLDIVIVLQQGVERTPIDNHRPRWFYSLDLGGAILPRDQSHFAHRRDRMQIGQHDTVSTENRKFTRDQDEHFVAGRVTPTNYVALGKFLQSADAEHVPRLGRRQILEDGDFSQGFDKVFAYFSSHGIRSELRRRAKGRKILGS